MSKFMIQGCTCMKDGGFEELQDKFGCKKNDNLLLTIHHMSERLDKLEQDNRDLRALLENRSTNKTIQLCDLPEPEISYDNWIELLLSSVKNELNRASHATSSRALGRGRCDAGSARNTADARAINRGAG
jgi:hypothetical protein